MEGENSPRKVRLSRWYRWFLFFIMVSIEGVMNVSAGLLSSATKEVKKSLNMNDAKFGSFGTANSFGRILSSTLFGMFNKKISRKWSTTLGIGLHALFIFCFQITNNANILIFVRGLHGFTQMPPSIYVPVWISQFAIRRYRTVQITSVQLSQTTGKTVGYFLNMLFGLENWKTGFLIEGIYLLFCTFCCLITSEDYFSRTLETVKKGSFFSDLKILSCHSLFMMSMLCRVILHGLNTCMHFWLADFMRNAILEKNQFKITICYSIICFSGPAGGILTNAILRPLIGNYDSRKASWPLVFIQLVASIFGVGIGFTRTTISCTIVTICFLIFNSSALPLLQGILISCVDPALSTTGFAITNVLTQVLTSGTTPLLYGMINDKFKDRYPWMAMVCIMSLEFVAVPLLSILAILRNKKFDEEERLKKKEEGEELIEK